MTVNYKVIKIIRLFAIVLLIWAGQAAAASNFVKIKLQNSVSVELPKNWSIASDNKRLTLDAWKESTLEARRLSDVDNEMPFAANYYSDDGETEGTIAIRFYPKLEITQGEAVAGGTAFIKELDEGVRQNFAAGLEAAGGQLVAWLGTTKKTINGSVYFVSENRQISPRGAAFRGYLVRSLNAGRSFTVILSYREDREYYLKPICDKIINSIHN